MKHLAQIHCWVWNWYGYDLQAIFGNCKEVPLLEHDTYWLLFLPSLFQHIFEFVKNIEVHDGPIEDLTFDRFFLRLASAGASYPQVWGLGNVMAGSPDTLHQLSPPQSGFCSYICKGVHFTNQGESLVVKYPEYHVS